jgi:hypothetical protein
VSRSNPLRTMPPFGRIPMTVGLAFLVTEPHIYSVNDYSNAQARPMKRCPECGRGGRGATRLSAPALLTLAAREVADGEDLEEETLPQLVLLLRELRAAERTIERRVSELTDLMFKRKRSSSE